MNKEELKEYLHKTIEEASDPGFAIHEMFKQRMKKIVASAIFCYIMESPEANFDELQEKVVWEHIMGFSDAFIEEKCEAQ